MFPKQTEIERSGGIYNASFNSAGHSKYAGSDKTHPERGQTIRLPRDKTSRTDQIERDRVI